MLMLTRSPRRRIVSLLAMFLFVLALNPVQASNPDTALDDYVNAPDPGFNYSMVAAPVPGDGYTLYLYYMTSQSWRDIKEVNRPLWSHWLAVIVPTVMTTNTGMLIIAGGNNLEPPDLTETELVIAAQIAKNSGSVVSVIGQIPNQPLFFYDEPYAHSEDELVAYTYDKALDTGDWNWPAYLPMTKASVRALDTIQIVTSDPIIAAIPVTHFVLTGFSKRGAITWLTAVVDPRVRAIAPGVFDILNMDEQVEHHFSAYGFYSDALDDYVNYNILRRVRTPEGQALMQVVDPISYKHRLMMPKFILNSSGDQFFTSDSARFYFDQLEGENLIRYVANTGHSLETTPDNIEDALTSLVSWYLGIIYNVPRPNISWQHADGQLVVQTDQHALYARLWQAHNPSARDFRLQTIGRSWSYIPLQPIAPGTYKVPVPMPEQGWTAYFIDLVYSGAANVPQTYSTSIFISPDSLPFEVTDPLLDPRGKGFWKHQVISAQTGDGGAQVAAQMLAGYFPIPLFGQYVTSIEDAAVIFTATPNEAQLRAQQQCLALRLNVRDSQLGWYTSVTVDNETRKLWQYYVKAHDAYLADNAQKAMAICAAINEM